MNPTAQLNYPFGEYFPQPGELHAVCAGVFWLRMTLPFALDHINLWLLEDENGWTIIDCGVANDDTRVNWEKIFERHLQNKPVTRVLVTHCHPDHLGLSDWLCQRWKAPLWMSATEYTTGRLTQAGLNGFDGNSFVSHFKQHGVTDEHLIAQILRRKNYYPNFVPSLPNTFFRIQEDQVIQIGAHQWRAITGFGHSPEHISLYCEELNCLIAGDMLLPRVSTNVSVWPIEPLANPVKQFLDSISRYLELPADMLVLPSHGKPFHGAHARVQQLSEHHVARLTEIQEACATPQSANDIVPLLFRRALDMHQLTFALGEALAHLHWLWFAGKLERLEEEDGIIRFASR
jgi:glyoxylase-like metal-dependent hydrolase (beta-lactamase superfamily II)